MLDPYAQAVAGQEVWGHKRTRTYHARVVRDSFDWGVQPQSSREMSDLIIMSYMSEDLQIIHPQESNIQELLQD